MLALILSCGGSPEPLIYSINNIEPDFVYFLCSKESESEVEKIISDVNYPYDKFSIKIVENHESMDDSFAKSREIIKELEDDYDTIHVDFTGGTKPMVAGLVLAAIGENCSYSYVGSVNSESRDKGGLGVVRNGFELIKEQKDPYDVFAVMEFEKGMDFFNRYQFNAACTNFHEANRKLESENLKELSNLYLDIVEAYDKWDKFNNKIVNVGLITRSFNKIKDTIDNSDNIKKYLNSEYPDFISQINNNLEFLRLKLSQGSPINPDDVPFYLADLLNNAERRIEETKFDDAVARLYRSIELIAQLKLVEYGLIDESILHNNSEFKINKAAILKMNNDDIQDFIDDIGGYNNKRTISIPLKKSYELLSILDCELAIDYLNDKKIKNNINFRNGSILAHGLKAINEDKANELYNQVLDYAKRAFPDVEKYMRMSKFPKFK